MDTVIDVVQDLVAVRVPREEVGDVEAGVGRVVAEELGQEA